MELKFLPILQGLLLFHGIEALVDKNCTENDYKVFLIQYQRSVRFLKDAKIAIMAK